MATAKTDETPQETTTAQGLTAPEVAPPDPGKTVTLVGPHGTKVTAPESSVESLKAAGYKTSK